MGLGSGLGLDYSSATLALLGPGLAVASEEAASYSLMRPWSGEPSAHASDSSILASTSAKCARRWCGRRGSVLTKLSMTW